jgi:dTDP-L-rhamnose 4-epimerase
VTTSQHVLVTGGAGFIGSHVVDRLLQTGHQVTVLDSLAPQVHGANATRPTYLHRDAELIVGDVRDRPLVEGLVARADSVIHLAAAVGLAQSMYEIERFVDVNCRGTAVLLDAVHRRTSKLRKLIVASSMSLYGEGRCVCSVHGPFDPALRSREQLARQDFEVRCPTCDAVATPAPTPESARLVPTTVYAVTKRDQEELVLAVGAAYKIPVVALRLFNVYGPRQALSNPYTGVGAIFSSRLLSGKSPLVFEDGLQTRDFTHVTDVAEAFLAVLEDTRADGAAYNVGAGRAYTLLDLGELLAQHIGVPWAPELTRTFREGDIRHCTADGGALERVIGFRPKIDFRDGVRDLVGWVRTQDASDHVDRAMDELKARGLIG